MELNDSKGLEGAGGKGKWEVFSLFVCSLYCENGKHMGYIFPKPHILFIPPMFGPLRVAKNLSFTMVWRL